MLNIKLISSHFLCSLLLCTLVALSGCGDDDEKDLPSTVLGQVVPVNLFAVNEAGEMPDKDDDLVFEFRNNNPVMLPDDSRQLTWGELTNDLKGEVTIECAEGGANIKVDVEGLIPGTVITFWAVFLDDPGFQPDNPAELFGIRAIGACGARDGSDNYIIADANGKGSIDVFLQTPDVFDMLDKTEAGCILTDEFEFHVVGAIHLDKKTHGSLLGPDGTALEYFAWIHKRG